MGKNLKITIVLLVFVILLGLFFRNYLFYYLVFPLIEGPSFSASDFDQQESIKRSLCYSDLPEDKVFCQVLIHKDPSLCEENVNQSDVDYCYYRYSSVGDNPDINTCSNIKGSNLKSNRWKFYCYTNIASRSGNISICESFLSDIPDRDHCFQRSATIFRETSKKESLNSCSKIVNIVQRNLCCSMNDVSSEECLSLVDMDNYVDTCDLDKYSMITCENVVYENKSVILYISTAYSKEAFGEIFTNINLSLSSCSQAKYFFFENIGLLEGRKSQITIPCELEEDLKILESSIEMVYMAHYSAGPDSIIRENGNFGLKLI